MNKLTKKEKIDAALKRGFPDSAIKGMFVELIETEAIRLDDAGNPYWETSGESLDPDVKLVFED
jgi:hypothetical protein